MLQDENKQQSMVALLQEFVNMDKQKRELDTDLKQIKKRLEELEPVLLDQLAQAGIQNMKIDGVTVYILRQLWAQALASNEEICEALRAAGLQDYVKEGYNSQSISAYFRELEKQDEPLPSELAGKIGTTEKFSLRTRK